MVKRSFSRPHVDGRLRKSSWKVLGKADFGDGDWYVGYQGKVLRDEDTAKKCGCGRRKHGADMVRLMRRTRGGGVHKKQKKGKQKKSSELEEESG